MQVRNLRSQLSFMLGENESLRREVTSMKRVLDSTKSAMLDLSTTHSSGAFVEGLTAEMQQLREELLTARDERDTALKEALLLKQVSLYFKHKDDAESKAVQDAMFSLEQAAKKKDWVIDRLQAQVNELSSKARAGGSVVVEKFVLEPTEWNMKFESRLRQRDKQIEQLRQQNQRLVKKIEEERLRAKNCEIDAEQQAQINGVLREQIEGLKKSLQAAQANAKAVPVVADGAMEARIQKIMKQAAAEKQKEIQKTQVIMQMQEQAAKPQPEVIIPSKTPPKAQAKPEEKPQKVMGTLQDAALSSIDVTGGRYEIAEHVPFNPLRPPVTETDQLDLTKQDPSFVQPNHEEGESGSNGLATDSMASVLLDFDMGLMEASQNHYKFKARVPNLNFEVMHIPVRTTPENPPPAGEQVVFQPQPLDRSQEDVNPFKSMNKSQTSYAPAGHSKSIDSQAKVPEHSWLSD